MTRYPSAAAVAITAMLVSLNTEGFDTLGILIFGGAVCLAILGNGSK